MSDQNQQRNYDRGYQTQLARREWQRHHGNIPHGWEIHHIDRNRNHNHIDNLVAMAPLDHRALHAEERNAALAVGRKKPHATIQFLCDECGNTAVAKVGGNRARFCSHACQCRAYRRRLKERQHG